MVRLISHSDLGPLVCGYAAKVCTSAEMPECPEELAVTMRKGEELPFKKALDHALASGHDSVLEHWSATFAIEGISRACSHQLVRHRVASYSQSSQRWANMDGFDCVIPESIQTTKGIIQFRCEPYSQELDSDTLLEAYQHLMEDIQLVYSEFIKCGVPAEDARYILPNACTTNIVMTMNARELKHFLGLRLCKRAQWEIRELARLMLELLKVECPELFENVGPQCEQKGFCPEEKSCGHRPTYDELLDREAGR